MFLSMLLAGCTKNGSEYFPETRVGARYEYSVEYQAPFAGVQKATMVVRTDSEEKIGGKRYYKSIAAFSGIPGLDQQVQYSRWASDGVHVIEGDNKGTPEYLGAPFPVTVGSSWISQTPKYRYEYRAVGIETVELPNRAYEKCLKLSLNDPSGSGGEGIQYLAPDIGMVKMVMHASGVPMTFTLEKYKR